ncbi:MAG TPA: polyprenyl synthetase family protein [Candidatus Humimicrobiaceae bacterium]|nr:polyprenyl synthetase family protein [Candidatus Humimicrobiaceae bacterium]
MPDQAKIKHQGIEEYLEKKKSEIDKLIEKYLPRKANKKWLEFAFGKPRYFYSQKAAQEVLIKPIYEFLDRGGKRWRPALFLLITEAVGGDIRKVKDFLIIPELAHDGSIITDDVEDQGELRRGKPCLHRIFGVDVAVNAGNFLYFLPLIILIKSKNKFKPKVLAKVYKAYAQDMINIHLGQGTDIYWHQGKAKTVNQKEYLQMCAFKTGCLSRLAAKLAVVLSGGSDKLAEKIGKMAEAIGVAFQIQDDILDLALEGKERKKFGKSFGNDIKEGKRTLIVIHALKKANRKDEKRLLSILDKHTDNPKERKKAIEIIKKYGSIDYARKVARKIIKESWQDAEKFLPESKAKAKLEEFVNYLIERKT